MSFFEFFNHDVTQPNPKALTHLEQLEAESIHVIREVVLAWEACSRDLQWRIQAQ